MSLFAKDNTTDKADKAGEKKSVSGSAKTAPMKDLYSGTAKTAPEGKGKTAKSGAAGNAYRILVRPLVTEKATHLNKLNQYAFEVSLQSNKIEIAKAVEEVYGIKPESVNVIRFEGKKKNTGRIRGKRKDWKKAIVTLPAGKTIEVYEGV